MAMSTARGSLQTIAQLVKMEQGLRIATVDFGGWDTHESQANSDGGGYLPDRLGQLSQGLDALFNDLLDYQSRLTIVVMSEFGRRLGRNASNGTDHGHGNVMLVLGGNVNGGKIYGNWPGLQDLDQGQDLRITTDYRVVLEPEDTFIGNLYTVLRATNIAGDGGGIAYPQLTQEAIIAANPDVIVLGDEAFGVSIDSVKARPGWDAIAAVQNERIYSIDPDIISRPGPRIVDALEELARKLYPELFP